MVTRSTLVILASSGLLAVSAAAPSWAAVLPTNGHQSVQRMGDNEQGEQNEKNEKNEKDIPVSQLPAAVVATVMKEVPGGKITGAEIDTQKGQKFYSMDVTGRKISYDLKTKEDGTFVSKEVDNDNDKD